MTSPIWSSYSTTGAALMRSDAGTLRTAYLGEPGAHGVYHRCHTPNTMLPPFEFTGRLKIHGWKQPHVFEWGDEATYTPALVFHVMHQSNRHNLVVGVGNPDRELASVSAEVDGRYGFRTGFTTRERLPDPTTFGRWHSFRVWASSLAEWGVDIDRVPVVHVVEKSPPTMTGPVGVGLRLDFLDVELADLSITEEAPMRSIRDIAPPQFRFLTAAEWGMTWKRPAVPEKLNDPEAYVHHSAGSRLGQDAVRAFQALNRFAQEGKKYSALDYDLLVHRATISGLVTIGAGRSEWMSAATKDRNELGEAVCAMGYFHPGSVLSEHPHPDEIEGIALAIVWGIEQGWIARDAITLGHRDNPAHPDASACPGDFLYPHLPHIRTRVAYWLARLADTTPPPSEDDDMIAVHERPYSSDEPTGDTYDFGPLAAGEVRKIPIVFGRRAKGSIMVETSAGRRGWVSLTGRAETVGESTLVTFEPRAGVQTRNAWFDLEFPDGHGYVKALVPLDRIVVDVSGIGQ